MKNSVDKVLTIFITNSLSLFILQIVKKKNKRRSLRINGKSLFLVSKGNRGRCSSLRLSGNECWF